MAGSERLDEDALLAAARSTAEAFAEFYEHFERTMLRFFMHATSRPELAADLTAETFARALESVASRLRHE
jgi:RNA polymerase sigma-70 factor (ECF subfamily)